MERQLYGWGAPRSLSTLNALLLLLCMVMLTAQLTLAIMINVWGPPPGLPLLPHRATQVVLLTAASGLVPSFIWPNWRGVTGPLIAALCLLSTTPVYSPHLLLYVLVSAGRSPGHGVATLISLVVGLTVTGLLIRGITQRARARLSLAKGSTTWGQGDALLNRDRGLLIGKLNKQFLRYAGGGHLLTIAATRSGKGVGTVIPNLLDYQGSAVVTDPKGENYQITAEYRALTLGHGTVPLDPFELVGGQKEKRWAFNPLDLVDLTSSDYVETAMMLADMMIGRERGGDTSHWHLEARALLFAYILHVVTSEPKDRQTLVRVRELLTEDPESMKFTLEAMRNSKTVQVREGAGRIQQKADREKSGVYSTALSYTHFLTSPRMQEVLTKTTCNLAALQNGKLSVYLILPREYLSAYAAWMRLMIACCYHMCTRNSPARRKGRVLFLLDEFANLGYIGPIKEAISLGAGYGITLWLVLQDLAQLRHTYRAEWESFVANCDVIQAFAIQDPFTGGVISKMLGEMTIWQRRLNETSRREGSRLSVGYSEESRPLLKPDELRRLHPNRQLLLVRPYQPVIADKLVYFKDPELSARVDGCTQAKDLNKVIQT